MSKGLRDCEHKICFSGEAVEMQDPDTIRHTRRKHDCLEDPLCVIDEESLSPMSTDYNDCYLCRSRGEIPKEIG